MSSLEWAAAVGAGWRDLVIEAVELIERQGGEVNTVKEKFGRLRVYYYTPDLPHAEADRLQLQIETLEARSGQICERCGQSGQQRRLGHWLVTRCEVCYLSEGGI